MSREVVCLHCRKGIRRRDDLVVTGRNLLPFHRRCWDEKSSPGRGFAYGLPVNGPATWIALVVLNLVVAIAYVALPSPDRGLLWIALAGNVGILGARLASWLTLERKLG